MEKIYTIDTDEKMAEALCSCAEVLLNGGIAAIPTDTVYGFAALVSNEAAIARLYQIKERSQIKSIAVLLGDVEQAELVAQDFPANAKRMAARYWPGALTLVVAKKQGLPANLSSNESIGIRIPDHAFARELIRRCGPLAVTSANHSGLPPARSIDEFYAQLGEYLDVVIDGGPSAGGVPSTVVNCSLQPAVILREGAISGEDLLRC